MGALIVMLPKKVLVDLVRGLVQCLKGSPFNRQAYEELFKPLYRFVPLVRCEGLIILEMHVADPMPDRDLRQVPHDRGKSPCHGVDLRRAVADH